MAGDRRPELRWGCLFLIAACLALGMTRPLAAAITIPDPGTYVVDPNNVLDAATRQTLESQLKELFDKTTAQVKILVVATLDGDDFFDFVQRHFDTWKLGTKQKRNGAIIALAVKEHKVRIQTGYDLEGTLPDSWSGSLSRETAAEFFKKGDYGGGLKKMTAAVANQIADEAGMKLTGVPDVRHVVETGPPPNQTAVLLGGFLVLLLIVYLIGRMTGNQGLVWALLWNTVGSGFGGGFSAGRSSGGGGSFGGGGSSGGGGGGAIW